MSRKDPNHKPLTIGDLIASVQSDSELSATRRRDLVSALRRFLQIAGQPESLPANFITVRRHFDRIDPAQAGLSRKTWSNLKSNLRFVLERYGAERRAPLPRDLPPDWRKLRSRLADLRLQRGLSNFVHFCGQNSIAPASVDDAVLETYRTDLHTRSLKANPDRLFRNVCVLWNRAVDEIAGWPERKVTVPSFRKRVSLPLEAFPAPFVEDLKAYRAFMSRENLFDAQAPTAPRKQTTLDGHHQHLWQLASALVESDFPIDRITSLAFLVQPHHARSAIQWTLERLRSERGITDTKVPIPPTLVEMASTLIVVARDYVDVTPDELAELEDMRSRLRSRTAQRRGMTDKNRARIRPMLDPKNQYRFLALGTHLQEQARKAKSPIKQARLVQTALLHELELIAPLRLGNLATLHLERNFRFSRPGGLGPVYLAVPGEEVKNGQALEFELPEPLVRLLLRYRDRYRAALIKGEDHGYLLPGEKGPHKHVASVRCQLMGAIDKWLGLTINPHLYRHLSAFFYLERHPTDFETVRRLLGHTSIDTTRMFYADFKSMAASRAYNDEILSRQRNLAIRFSREEGSRS